MKLQKIGLTALFAILATLSDCDWRSIVNSQLKTSRGVALAQTPADRKAEADRLFEQGNQLGSAYREVAIELYQQALNLYRRINDRKMELQVLAKLGWRYYFQEDYVKAIEYYQLCLALAQELRDWKEAASVLTRLGYFYRTLGNFTEAIKYYEQALALTRKTKDLKEEFKVLRSIVDVYPIFGQNAKVIESYQRLLEIAREIKDSREELKVLADLGWFYHELGNNNKAIEYYQQAITIARKNKNSRALNARLTGLGLLYSRIGDYIKAIESYQEALAIAREFKNRSDECEALRLLGNAHRKRGDYAEAIEYYQQSLVIARETKDSFQETLILQDMPTVYFDSGNYTIALDYAQRMLASDEPTRQNFWLRYLGRIYLYLGNYSKAIEYAQTSLALEKVTGTGSRLVQEEALFILGFALYYSGKLAEAEKVFFDRMLILESLRAEQGNFENKKVSTFEEQVPTYEVLQEILIARNKANTALEISERGRARIFVELLARRLSSIPIEPAKVSPPTLDQIKQIAKAQNTTLVQYSIINSNYWVKKKLQSRESALYIWVIKPTGEVTFRQADLKPLWQQQNTSLTELVVTSRDSIGVRSNPIVGVVPRQPGQKPPDPNQQLQQLHQILIEPIADLLPTDPNAKVTFIPQRSLFLVPFAALKDKAGQYLIEKHTILTAPSIQILELTHKQKAQVGSGEALIVGNPTMPSVPPEPGEPHVQLPSLPGAEKEVLAIAPLLNTKAIVGNQATKASIVQQMPNARIIHLATHGLLDDGIEAGVPGAIALAPSGDDKGLLTANEILEMKLKADLVVLSACNTGRGRITGDGVVGLSRSFISAGVPSIVVSLWSVPDAPTASLMTNFYQNLQQNPNKAQALRQAMLTTMKQHPDPKDWAAFTLVGEAE